MKKYTILFLLLVMLLAGVMRFYKLGSVPPSPNWDEVALGYNAYSLLHTGRDEYGQLLPIVLRSYDDYKPALYAYLVVPFVAVFGLNTISVRLPSAVLGMITVLAVYFLVRELLNRKEVEIHKRIISAETIALLSAFLLAISPWHIQFSRIGFESNVGLALNVLGALFFLKGVRRPLFLTIAAFFFTMSLYVYQSEKVFVPLLVLTFLILFYKSLLQIPKKYLFLAAATGLTLITPLIIYSVTNQEAFARARGVSVFSDKTQFLKQNVAKVIRDKERNDFIGVVLDNRRFLYARAIVSGYLSHYDLNWLFITGDLARHHAPQMGLLYWWELPFLFIGIYIVFFSKLERRTKLILFLWFFLAPVPASITSGVPHAVRTLNFLPMFQIFVAFGLVETFYYIKTRNSLVMKAFSYLYICFIVFNVSYFLNQYFVQQNYFNSLDWQYGYKEAISYVKEHQGEYEKIVVDNKPHLDQSYMFFLFYLQYPPREYQEVGKSASGGFKENHAFGKFSFRPIDWSKEERSSRVLYFGKPSDFPKDATLLKQVTFLNGEPAIKIVR